MPNFSLSVFCSNRLSYKNIPTFRMALSTQLERNTREAKLCFIVPEVILMPVQILTQRLFATSLSVPIRSVPYQLFPASLIVLGAMLPFIVWIPSNPESAYTWKKQTSLLWIILNFHERFYVPLAFALWICLLRSSSHLYFSSLRPF